MTSASFSTPRAAGWDAGDSKSTAAPNGKVDDPIMVDGIVSQCKWGQPVPALLNRRKFYPVRFRTGSGVRRGSCNRRLIIRLSGQPKILPFVRGPVWFAAQL